MIQKSAAAAIGVAFAIALLALQPTGATADTGSANGANGVRISVSPRTVKERDAEVMVEVRGSGFSTTANSGFGVYVSFGRKPTGNRVGNPAFVDATVAYDNGSGKGTKWVRPGSSSGPNQATMKDDGSFTIQLAVRRSFTAPNGVSHDADKQTLGVYVYAAHGTEGQSGGFSQYAFVALKFPAAATPKPATPTPKPATPKPATPKPATPKPATPRPATPKPATPRPTDQPQATAKPPKTPRPSDAPPPTTQPTKTPRPSKTPRPGKSAQPPESAQPSDPSVPSSTTLQQPSDTPQQPSDTPPTAMSTASPAQVLAPTLPPPTSTSPAPRSSPQPVGDAGPDQTNAVAGIGPSIPLILGLAILALWVLGGLFRKRAGQQR